MRVSRNCFAKGFRRVMLRQQKSAAAICDAADGTGSEIVFPSHKFETQSPKNPHKLSVVPSRDSLRRFRVLCIDLQAGFSALISVLIPKCVWSLSYSSICVHWVEKFFVAVRNAITISVYKIDFSIGFLTFSFSPKRVVWKGRRPEETLLLMCAIDVFVMWFRNQST